jgi:hypothetical protein
MSVAGGASTQALAAYLASNYLDLRYLIDESGMSKIGRIHLSLLLRMAGFQNSPAHRRMDSCNLNTTGRAWSLPRNLKHTTLQSLIDNAEIMMMKAQDIDTQEARSERNELESKIETPVIEDLI